MRLKKASLCAFLIVFVFITIGFCSDLVPLYSQPEKHRLELDRLNPGMGSPLDPLYELTYTDGIAEYYLGSGATDDTFFVVFEPQSACSVYYAEMMWYNVGNVNAFAAWYSDEAQAMYPGGSAPPRGESPVSPIGEWIAGPVPNTSTATMDWELLDLGGVQFICGDPVTLESDQFGIGFIKSDAIPNPLADNVSAQGIYESRTWFGGPWMATYPHDWGAYSSNFSGTVIEMMLRVWVSYFGGGYILIGDVFQQSDTYSLTGPFTITCTLDDENGIGPDDVVELHYTVNGGDAVIIPLEETLPGSGYFGADISGLFSVGDEIEYWIYTVKENGMENISPVKGFMVTEPDNPDADLLLVDDSIYDPNASAYIEALNLLGISYEIWAVEEHGGIDESVVNWGWEHIFLAGWGISTLPVEDEANAYSAFLDNGGNLFLNDQDYFYANSMPAQGTLSPGDFAYDYLGCGEYWNDPMSQGDENYFGCPADPVSFSFANSPYETYWDDTGLHMSPGQFWVDYMTPGLGEEIFWGEDDGETYGLRYDSGTFKTVFLCFMAEASCEYNQITFEMEASPEFITLLENVAEWFGLETQIANDVTISLEPHNIPITIPAGGGSFEFDLTVENSGPQPQVADVWTDVTLPNGTIYPLILREDVTIPAGQVVERPDLSQFVPAGAPAGSYVYNAYIQDSAQQIVLSYDTFPFEKLQGDNAPNHDNGWNLYGWGTELPASVLPEEFSVASPYPNPFNPETSLEIVLPGLSRIDISVYNVTGRKVDDIFSGMKAGGIHEFSWNAADFTSGVYFCRIDSKYGSETMKLLLVK